MAFEFILHKLYTQHFLFNFVIKLPFAFLETETVRIHNSVLILLLVTNMYYTECIFMEQRWSYVQIQI